MSNLFFTSDLHFGYHSLYKYSEKYNHILRPEFSDANEADAEIIRRYNSIVNHDDTVYFLGDLAKTSKDLEKIKFLKGNKFLVAGNHDAKFDTAFLLKYFRKVFGITYKNQYVLTHTPIHHSQLRDMTNAHGHTHRCIIANRQYLNCCVEVNNYYPVLIEN